MIKDTEKFALAVISSSSPDLSIADKIKLYEETIQAVENHNQPQLEAQKQQHTDNAKAFMEAFSKNI